MLKFLLLLLPIFCVGQKPQVVTVKPTTGIVNLKVAKGQKIQIQVNGRAWEPEVYPTIKRALNLKDFSDWRLAFNEAIVQGLPLEGDSLVIDGDDPELRKNTWDGKLTLQGVGGNPLIIKIRFKNQTQTDAYGIYLGSGDKVFNDVVFIKEGVNNLAGCIQTEQADINYNLTFKRCKWVGDWRYNFQSTIGHGSVLFDSCKLFAVDECIQYFAQLGSKKIDVLNSTLECKTSHTFYIHPWCSVRMENVTVKGCGKLAGKLYSASPEKYPFKSEYCIFKNCRNEPGIKSPMTNDSPMWEIWSQGADIEMDNCNLPTYEWVGSFTISNSNISNAGGGSAIYGNASLKNCTGEITVVNQVVIADSKMNIIGVNGGSVWATNSSVSFYDKFNPTSFTANFQKCKVGDVTINVTAPNFMFDNCVFNSQYKAIRVFGPVSSIDGINFIGNTYPIVKL